MFHIDIIKDGDVTKVVKEVLVDGQMYVDSEAREGSPNLVTSDGVKKAMDDTVSYAFDNGTPAGQGDEIEFHDSTAYNKYELNKFYSANGKLYVCTQREKIGDEAPYTYNITLSSLNGVADGLNYIVDLINSQE